MVINASLSTLSLCAWACLAAWSDWRSRRLPNTLTLGAMGVGLICLLCFGKSWSGGALTSAWLAFGTAAVLTLPGYALGKLGAGDAKLLMAMGMLTDMRTLLTTFCIGAMLGVAMGLWPALLRLLMGILPLPPTWQQMQPPGVTMRSQGKHIPFGAALAVGFVCALQPSMS
jgi:prepilin peptidase CpaA